MRTLILLSAAVFLYGGNTYQLPLKPGVWHLIGINGLHHRSAETFEIGWEVLKETNDLDGNFTWEFNADGTLNYGSLNGGSERRSAIGIRIVPGAEIGNAQISYQRLSKDSNYSMAGMYVSGGEEGGMAVLHIRFQDNYIGRPFHLSFDNGVVLQGVFDSKYTEANPANLPVKKSTASAAVSRIIETVDANLSDNNISMLDYFDVNCEALFCMDQTSTIIVGGRQRLENSESITVYSWDAQKSMWRVYNSASSSGSFENFEAGKAYWVRVETTSDDAGLILSSGDLKDESYVKDGNVQLYWNMLSFNDSFLRKTPSAVFVTYSTGNDVVKVRDNFAKSAVEIDTNKSAAEAAKLFNMHMYAIDLIGLNSAKIRAYPAKDSTSKEGVLIISDEDFGVHLEGNASARSVAGRSLTAGYNEAEPYDFSPVDEHILALKINEHFLSYSGGKKTAFQVGFVGGAVKTVDLSAARGLNDAIMALGTINAGGKQDFVMIDIDFNGSYETAVIGSTSRVYARDTTYMKLFDYVGGAGDWFSLIGDSEVRVEYGGSRDDTVSSINDKNASTGIVAYPVGTDSILLSSITARGFDLKELKTRTQFTDRYLFDEDNLLTLGAIDEVFAAESLAAAPVGQTGATKRAVRMTGDLTFAAQFGQDFPVSGPLYALQKAAGGNSSPELLLSGVTRNDNTIMWHQADTSIPVDSQRMTNSLFNLYKVHKERGYWVYMQPTDAQNPPSISSWEFVSNVTRHYSNIFDVNGSNGVAPTHNQITLDLTVYANGFNGLASSAFEMPENIFAHIDGAQYALLKNGAAYNYSAYFSDRDMEALRERDVDSPKMRIGINLTNGLGAALIDRKYEFDNRKPSVPQYQFDNSRMNGGIKIESKGASQLYIYDGNLSDKGNDGYLIYSGAASGAQDGFNIYEQPRLTFGTKEHPYYDLRIIGEGTNKLQSDTKRLLFAPVYKAAHLLSTDSNSSTGRSGVIAYDHYGQNPTQYQIGVHKDSGVQITSSDQNITTITYKPLPINFVDCGAPLTSDIYLSNNKIATILYCPIYNGMVFYAYHKGENRLAYGLFQASGGNVSLNVIEGNQTIDDPRLQAALP
ncbi:MAG: hypothetical protein LBT81_05115 [Helicobacteraceae bacterium]|jgi:hypothetical protein|nr:hypothetical protein [Helicobacteraceae bacterium]